MQVTNPPIDPLREGLVMSLNMRLGKRGNLLQPGPGAYRQLLLESPILLESELEAIQTSSGLTCKVPFLSHPPTSYWTSLAQILMQLKVRHVIPIFSAIGYQLDPCFGRHVLCKLSCAASIFTFSHSTCTGVAGRLCSFQDLRLITAVFAVQTFSLHYQSGKAGAMEDALHKLCEDVEAAVRAGTEIVTLSDRQGKEGLDIQKPPIPTLLAVGAVHHHLIKWATQRFQSCPLLQ